MLNPDLFTAAAAGACLALGLMVFAGPRHPPALECRAVYHDGYTISYPVERIRIDRDGWLHASQSIDPLFGWKYVECGP